MSNTVLITGGSGGIGLCLAREFAANGNDIILVSSSEDRLMRAKAELERLLERGFISALTAELVNISHLEKFRKSPLLSELIRAKDVKREFRFNVMLDASELTDNEMLQRERVLVQGVIDCLYENENGEMVLVDYKTDYVTEENYEEVLRERHSLQLGYYKRALELMLEKPLSRVEIYSVPLAKVVEI